MPKGQKKFALIWWVKTGEKDVVNLSMIPRNQRQLNAIITLTWRNFETKTDVKAEAKLLAIGEENEMHRKIVTNCGTLHNLEDKILSEEVQNSQKDFKRKRKVSEMMKRSNIKKIDEQIGQDKPIFAKSECKRRKENIAPTNNFESSTDLYQPSYESHVTKSTFANLDFETQFSQPSTSKQNYQGNQFPTIDTQAFYSPNVQDSISQKSSPLKPVFTMSNYPFPQTKLTDLSKSNAVPLQKGNESIVHRKNPSTHAENPVPSRANSLSEKGDASVSDENDEPETSSQKSKENESSFHFGFYGKVTKMDVERQKQVYLAMKRAYELQQINDVESKETFSVPDTYFQSAENMVEISPNSGVLLPPSRQKYIQDKALLYTEWKIIVREVLLEVYGQSIANYSATGKRTHRPAIDFRILHGIHEWINRTSLGPVAKGDLIDVINKIASNKRKYRKCA